MYKIPFIAASLAAIVTVSACQSIRTMGEDDYVVTSATPDSITLRFREGDLNKATARAEAHCKETNRMASMINVMPDNNYSLASFRCGT